MKRTRVVLIHYTSPSVLGGVEQVMGAHATGLHDLGLDVRILAGRGRATPRGVRFTRVPLVDSRHPAILRTFRALAAGEVPADLRDLTQRLVSALRPHVDRADRVVVHNAFTLHKNAPLTAALVALARERPGRFIAWTHDLAWSDPQYRGERHPGEPWDLYARAASGVRYVAVSDERARQLAELTGLPRERIAVVDNGVDLDGTLGLSARGTAFAKRLGLLDAELVLLLPARLTRRKRIEAAIDALAVLRSRGRRAALVVTGPPGAHNATNAAYAADLAARAQRVEGVHLLHALGIRVDARLLADLYALADVLVLPSQSEGFGIPLLEAGLRRLPIVCSDLASLRSVAGAAATYVPADADGAAIANAIEARLAEDETHRLRAKAKEHAWPRIVRERVLPAIVMNK